MDEAALNRVLVRWRQRHGDSSQVVLSPHGERAPSPQTWNILEPPAPPPVTLEEKEADLDAEDALFRMWWGTLPDQPLARRCFHSYVVFYCQGKGLGKEIEWELERRCQDLLEKKP